MAVAARLREQDRTAESAGCLHCPVLSAFPWSERVRPVLMLAELRVVDGDLDGALEILLRHADLAAGPADETGQRARAALENALGVLNRTAGRLDDAAAHYESALARLRGLEPGDDLADLLHNLAGLCHARSASAEGVEHGRAGLELRVRLHGTCHELVAADQANLAGLLYDAGCLDEAEALFSAAVATFTRALGEDHVEVAVCLSGMASIQAARGDRADAERLYRRAIGIKAGRLGRQHFDTLVTEYNLARLLFEDGRPDEARSIAERVVSGLEPVVDSGHRVLARARDLIAHLDAA